MAEPVKGTTWVHPTRKDWDGDSLILTVTVVRDHPRLGRTVYSRGPNGDKTRSQLLWWQNNARNVREPVKAPRVSSPKFTNNQASALFERADKAGHVAAKAAIPVPMHVVQRANPLDDNSPIVRDYGPQSEGLCGFAWITIRPGNSSFANWLKRTERGSSAYGGGVSVWVSGYDQSVTRKEAYALAFAQVLRDADVQAVADSRLD